MKYNKDYLHSYIAKIDRANIVAPLNISNPAKYWAESLSDLILLVHSNVEFKVYCLYPVTQKTTYNAY